MDLDKANLAAVLQKRIDRQNAEAREAQGQENYTVMASKLYAVWELVLVGRYFGIHLLVEGQHPTEAMDPWLLDYP